MEKQTKQSKICAPLLTSMGAKQRETKLILRCAQFKKQLHKFFSQKVKANMWKHVQMENTNISNSTEFDNYSSFVNLSVLHIDAAGINEEGGDLFTRILFCPGPASNFCHEDHHSLPQCCLVIFGAVDIPAKVVVTVSMSMIGRRISQSVALILSGVTILINLFVPYDMQTLRTCLAVLGKGCLAASFNCCYLYSGELFPTVIRQSGMGWVSMVARFGAMVAPMVQLSGELVPWLPGLIYGGTPILSGMVAIFLPETLASPLPDTIQDIEERSLKNSSSLSVSQKEELRLNDTKDNTLNEV